jgi:hypothetical protein
MNTPGKFYSKPIIPAKFIIAVMFSVATWVVFHRYGENGNGNLATVFVGSVKSLHEFYIDSKNGSDGNDGHSPQSAWKSLSKVNERQFLSGDQIYFKCGSTWHGQLHPQGSGDKELAITVRSYGRGARPVIAGDGVSNGAIYINNQSYWEFSGLSITNYNSAEEGGLDLNTWEAKNKSDYALVSLPPQLTKRNTPKYGIYISGNDTGKLGHIYLKNLEVHGVNGYINQKDEQSKNNGGIVFEITGNSRPTYFVDVLIVSCNIHDVDRTGILICKSSWDSRSLDDNKSWTPSKDIHIRNCSFSQTGANALIVRVAKNPVIENNLFDHCAIKGSGNACFSFNCDSAIWQKNECRFTKANMDDVDAGGMDADYKSKHTIIQYNYSHNNDYGMLITGGPKFFNQGTIVRYNIFENEGDFVHPKHGKTVMRVNGSATDTHIYNNVFYLNAKQKDIKIVSHETWITSPQNTTYNNNIFYNLSSDASYNLGESTGNIFDHNLFFGNTSINEPADAAKVSQDPLFVEPGARDTKGYQLKRRSPALFSGALIPQNGGQDFYGNPLNTTTNPNIGVYNGLAK